MTNPIDARPRRKYSVTNRVMDICRRNSEGFRTFVPSHLRCEQAIKIQNDHRPVHYCTPNVFRCHEQRRIYPKVSYGRKLYGFLATYSHEPKSIQTTYAVSWRFPEEGKAYNVSCPEVLARIDAVRLPGNDFACICLRVFLFSLRRGTRRKFQQ